MHLKIVNLQYLKDDILMESATISVSPTLHTHMHTMFLQRTFSVECLEVRVFLHSLESVGTVKGSISYPRYKSWLSYFLVLFILLSYITSWRAAYTICDTGTLNLSLRPWGSQNIHVNHSLSSRYSARDSHMAVCIGTSSIYYMPWCTGE